MAEPVQMHPVGHRLVLLRNNAEEPHFDCLKKIPFYNFVIPFIKGKYSAGEV